MIKKMTNGYMVDIVNQIAEMQRAEKADGKKLFPGKIKAVYALKANQENMLKLLKPFEEARRELLTECVEGPLNGNEVTIKKECVEKWNTGMKELFDIEMDVEICTVNLDYLEGLSLSIEEMDTIKFMIEEVTIANTAK